MSFLNRNRILLAVAILFGIAATAAAYQASTIEESHRISPEDSSKSCSLLMRKSRSCFTSDSMCYICRHTFPVPSILVPAPIRTRSHGCASA